MKSSNWLDTYEIAKKYYLEHGNLNIPRKNEKIGGVNLGSWITNQRSYAKYNKLSIERIELLNQIGMVWDLYGSNWDKMYKIAKEYYLKYGNLSIRASYEKKYHLASWVKRQRKAYKNKTLSKQRIDLLNEIGIVWDTNELRDENWEKTYKMAKAYYEKNGNLDVPYEFKTKDGINYDKKGKQLYMWLFGNIKSYENHKLSEEKINKLNQININWSYRPVSRDWNEKYELAKKYYEYYGNLLVNINFKTKDGIIEDKEGIRLGGFIHNNRQLYKRNELSEDKKELLNQIRMIWDVSLAKKNNEVIDNNWNKKYELAKKYYERHGNTNIPLEFNTLDGITYNKNGIKLGSWVAINRTLYKKKELNENQIKLLDDIDFVIDLREDNWNKMYDLACKYHDYYKDLLISIEFKTFDGVTYNKNGKKLGLWINSQRKIYRNPKLGNLNKNRIELLNKIGMVWNIEKIDTKRITHKWMENYELVKVYYEKYGDLEIPYDFKTKDGINYDENGLAISRWLRYNKICYKKKELNEYQFKLLNEINFASSTIETIGFSWYKKYELAKKYYEVNGNLDIPYGFRTVDGINYDNKGVKLGKWLKTQKSASEGKLTLNISDEQIKLLKEIGMNIETKIENDETDSLKYNWRRNYELAKDYYMKYGDLKIPITYETDNRIKLGQWIMTQRKKYKAKTLSRLEIDLLNQIGMIWSIGIRKARDIETYSPNWLHKYSLLKKYYEIHGNIFIPDNFRTKDGINYNEFGTNLSTWLRTQRQAYKGNSDCIITFEQIKLLEQLGMKWFDDDLDKKHQEEKIDEKTKQKKEIEILNRFKSYLLKYDSESLPSKEEINKEFIKVLSRGDKNVY